MLKGRIRLANEPWDPAMRRLKPSDLPYLRSWFLAGETLKWFPMQTPEEIEVDLKLWMQYAEIGAAIVLEEESRPVVAGVLYLLPTRRQMHQCLFAIIGDDEKRGQGLGTRLMKSLMRLAKERFGIELLQLEVYEGNPAKRLYERLGFIEYGKEEDFVRYLGEPIAKIVMYKWL